MLKHWFLSRRGLVVRRGMVLLSLCVIARLSLMDTAKLSGSVGDCIVQTVSRALSLSPDKCVHFTLYFGLTLMLWQSLPLRVGLPFPRLRLLSPFIAGLGAILWGILMELAQRLTFLLHWGNRQFEGADILANSLGALAMTLLLLPLHRRLTHALTHRRPPRNAS